MLVHSYRGNSNYYFKSSVSEGGKMVAIHDGNEIAVLDPIEAKVLRRIAGQFESVTFSKDSKYAIVTSISRTMSVHKIDSGQKLLMPDDLTRNVVWAEFFPNGECIVFCKGNGSVIVWDINKSERIFEVALILRENSEVTISKDGLKMIVSDAACLRLFDFEQVSFMSTISLNRSHATSIAFSPRDNSFLVGCFDGSVLLYDDEGMILEQFDKQSNAIESIRFCSSINCIMVAEGNSIGFIDITTGTVFRRFKGHSDLVLSVAFSSDKLYMLTTSQDKDVRIWNTLNGECIAVLKTNVNALTASFSCDRNFIVTSNADGSSSLWKKRRSEKMIGILSLFEFWVLVSCISIIISRNIASLRLLSNRTIS